MRNNRKNEEMKSSKLHLLGDEEQGVDNSSKKKKIAFDTGNAQDASTLTINRKFATQFEEKERQKELRRARNIQLDEEDEFSDSESDESEDEEAVLLSPGLDVKILKTLNMIKKKDPKIYDSKTVLFSDPESGSDDEEESEESEAKGHTKKKTYKDIIRDQILQKNDDNESDEDNDEEQEREAKFFHPKNQLLYDREQQEIRRAFLTAAGTGNKKRGKTDSDEEEEEAEEDNEQENMFRVKKKTPAQLKEDELQLQEELAEFEKNLLTESSGREKPEEESENNNSNPANAEDKFLLNYLKNKMWKEKPVSFGGRFQDEDSIDEEEDEKELDASELFESKYNFRFEQLQEEKDKILLGDDDPRSAYLGISGLGVSATDGMQVIGHARQTTGSLRRVDDKRKQQRKEREEKKEKEKRQKQEELKRLKNLKREEVSLLFVVPFVL
jgi:protein KRI1